MSNPRQVRVSRSNRTGNPQPSAAQVRVLLTVLGTNPRSATYSRGDKFFTTNLAPVALWELLNEEERPHKVIALCTRRAKEETLPELVKAKLAWDVMAVDVPSGESHDEIREFLRLTVRAIPPGHVDLIVDITHGPRHLSLLTYLATLYLVALRGVKLTGAHYGLLRNEGQVSPFLDLRPLLDLPRWLHALETLRETGSAQPIAKILREGPPSKFGNSAAKDLSHISAAFLRGLPLELGKQADDFCRQRMTPIKRHLEDKHHLPLAEELTETLQDMLAPLAHSSARGDGWKGKTKLTLDELARQGRIIERALECGNLSAALGMLNEWTTSWAAWRCNKGETWLDYMPTRRSAAGFLGALMSARKTPALRKLMTEAQVELADYWDTLSQLRNAHHHQGMRPEVMVPNPRREDDVRRVFDYWRSHLCSCPTDIPLQATGPHHAKVLITPLGLRPGVLFSAIHACGETPMPDYCIVICSEQSRALASEAALQANFHGTLDTRIISSAGSIKSNIEQLIQEVRPILFQAEQVMVNVTGGTTLMGLTAEAAAKAAQSLAKPVRRFGLLDMRTPQEQDAQPYLAGFPFWLDDDIPSSPSEG